MITVEPAVWLAGETFQVRIRGGFPAHVDNLALTLTDAAGGEYDILAEAGPLTDWDTGEVLYSCEGEKLDDTQWGVVEEAPADSDRWRTIVARVTLPDDFPIGLATLNFSYNDGTTHDFMLRDMVNIIKVEFVDIEDYPISTIPSIENRLLGQILEESSVEGPGRPPTGSGFLSLATPFEANLEFVNTDAIRENVEDQIHVVLTSNTDDTVVERDLIESGPNTFYFADQEGQAVVRIVPTELTADIDQLRVTVQDVTFGQLTFRDILITETGPTSNEFTSERLTVDIQFDLVNSTADMTLYSNGQIVHTDLLNQVAEDRFESATTTISIERSTGFDVNTTDDMTIAIWGTPLELEGRVVDAMETDQATVMFKTVAIQTVVVVGPREDPAPMFPPQNLFRIYIYDQQDQEPQTCPMDIVKDGEIVGTVQVEFSGGYPSKSKQIFLACSGEYTQEMQNRLPSNIVLIDPEPALLELTVQGSLKAKKATTATQRFPRRVYISQNDPAPATVDIVAEVDKGESLSHRLAGDTQAVTTMTFTKISEEDVQARPGRVKVTYRLSCKGAQIGIASVSITTSYSRKLPGSVMGRDGQWTGPPRTQTVNDVLLATVSIHVTSDAGRQLALDLREAGFMPDPKGCNLSTAAGRRQWVEKVTKIMGITYIEAPSVSWEDTRVINVKQRTVRIGTKELVSDPAMLPWILDVMIHEAAELRANDDFAGGSMGGALFNPGIHDCALAAEIVYMKDTGVSASSWYQIRWADGKGYGKSWVYLRENEDAIRALLNAYRNGTRADKSITIRRGEKAPSKARYIIESLD